MKQWRGSHDLRGLPLSLDYPLHVQWPFLNAFYRVMHLLYSYVSKLKPSHACCFAFEYNLIVFIIIIIPIILGIHGVD